MDEMTGIYVMLIFLDGFLNFGQGKILNLLHCNHHNIQKDNNNHFYLRLSSNNENSFSILGIFAFIIFGLQSGYVFLPLKGWCQKLIYGQYSLVLTPWEDVSDETKAVCQQFLKHHINHCMDSIIKDVRTRFRSIQKGVFYGSDLVDWLLEVGLTHSRQDAVIYGRHLITGK